MVERTEKLGANAKTKGNFLFLVHSNSNMHASRWIRIQNRIKTFQIKTESRTYFPGCLILSNRSVYLRLYLDEHCFDIKLSSFQMCFKLNEFRVNNIEYVCIWSDLKHVLSWFYSHKKNEEEVKINVETKIA